MITVRTKQLCYLLLQNLKSLEDHDVMEDIEPIPVAIVTAQLELVRAWRALLLVATSCHVSFTLL